LSNSTIWARPRTAWEYRNPPRASRFEKLKIASVCDYFRAAPGGMQPTPLGALLGTHIRRALAEIRAGEVAVKSLRGALAGGVAVGTLSLGRTRLLPRAIIQLTQQYPNLTVSTVEGAFEHLAMRLRAGDIDFILGALRAPEHTVGLTRDIVAHDVLSLVVGKSHPLARRRTLAYSHLASVERVLPPRGTPIREMIESAMRKNRVSEPRVVVETTDLAITRGLLTGSHMVTAVSAHLFFDELRAKILQILPLELPETRGVVHACGPNSATYHHSDFPPRSRSDIRGEAKFKDRPPSN
jgi:LysR family transcriptional regulator, regulator for genes of the gallate degradation pathway